MPDEWVVPQISQDSDGPLSVESVAGDVSVDMSNVSDPDDVEVVEDALSDGVVFDVSGNEVSRVHMSIDDFMAFVSQNGQEVQEDLPEDVSGNDLDLMPLAVDGDDISVSSFSPQQWQINMAENRPVGWHYLMTRTGTNTNNYVLVLGRDIVYQDGLYTYTDCDFYSVYTTGSSGTTRYHYDIYDHWTGTINSSSYVVYSDLYFDYLGSRSVPYTWLIIFFMVLMLLFLIFFRGNRN